MISDRQTKNAARPDQQELTFYLTGPGTKEGPPVRVVVNDAGPWFCVKDILKAVSTQKQIGLDKKLNPHEYRKMTHGRNRLRFVNRTGLVGLAGGSRSNYKTRRLIVVLLAACPFDKYPETAFINP